MGGSQVAGMWLKDRKGRKLAYDDLETCRRIIAALGETRRLMEDKAEAIAEHSGWPME